ncbi:hypothetical protein D3C85_1346100 [compost metagenome]
MKTGNKVGRDVYFVDLSVIQLPFKAKGRVSGPSHIRYGKVPGRRQQGGSRAATVRRIPRNGQGVAALEYISSRTGTVWRPITRAEEVPWQTKTS